jgi:hypothetical protein
MMRIVRNICILFFLLGAPYGVHAQVQSLSVTPPLFQVSVEPGSIWQSSIRIVNPNNFPLTVYAEVTNFAPSGEGGQGTFLPVLHDDTGKISLAEWITLNKGPYTIPGGQTQEISFIVEVPNDAAPGGHFAAILVSTEPPTDELGPIALATSQTVTSLFFARIEGDITEIGNIREFSVHERSLDNPQVEFSLRFENKGNVHIQPRGFIRIHDMWGNERGTIPINSESHYGNVLPDSIRDFRFSWEGNTSLSRIGRYRAEVALVYGQNEAQSTTGYTSFWIIPIRGLLITLVSLGVSVLVIIWLIRIYIRSMLIRAGIDPDQRRLKKIEEKHTQRAIQEQREPKKGSSFTALHSSKKNIFTLLDMLITLTGFVFHYKKFSIALALLIALFVLFVVTMT